MEALIYIAATIYLIYNTATILKNGDLTETLSDTYYVWPKWVFPLVMTILGFSMLPVWLEATINSPLQFLSFLSCASFIFVGFVPNFRNDKEEYKIHVTCGYLATGIALLSLILVLGNWEIFPALLLASYILDFGEFRKHYIYHIENSLIVSILLSII